MRPTDQGETELDRECTFSHALFPTKARNSGRDFAGAGRAFGKNPTIRALVVSVNSVLSSYLYRYTVDRSNGLSHLVNLSSTYNIVAL